MYLVNLFDRAGRASYVAHPGGRNKPGPGNMAKGSLLTNKRQKAFVFASLEECRSFLAWFRRVTEDKGSSSASSWTSVVEEVAAPEIPDALPAQLDEGAVPADPRSTSTAQGTRPMLLTKTTDQVLHGISKEEFAGHLRAAGYHCVDAGETLESAASGLRFGVFFSRPDPISAKAKSLQFLCGMRAAGEKDLVERANRWNREHRFPKLFIDGEGDLIATMDFLVEGVTQAYLTDVVGFWTLALGQMRREF
jgi:hypothetical protein